MSESTQKKLDRIRPPRVQITYETHVGNATEKKELPFVAGIMADLSGKREQPLPKVKERKFVQIDGQNFDDVLAAAAPRLAFQVANRLQDDGGKINVLLKFSEFEDFSPVSLIRQVPALSRLYDARMRLRDLLAKLDGNEELGNLLNEVVSHTEQQSELRSLLGADPTTDPAPPQQPTE